MKLTWTLAIFMGLLCGALYHLYRGKTFRELFTYLLAGALGFVVGHTMGYLFLPSFPITLGDLHILEGLLLSFGTLRLAEWLKV
ncbi:MAG: hypothetical protein RMK30_06580 [Anaerolineae bacterium]|nr:hypothetical protein [Anaerolineae bacterium]MDW8102525.1 hypothetical protein [Anaerolineae bacterium]